MWVNAGLGKGKGPACGCPTQQAAEPCGAMLGPGEEGGTQGTNGVHITRQKKSCVRGCQGMGPQPQAPTPPSGSLGAALGAEPGMHQVRAASALHS